MKIRESLIRYHIAQAEMAAAKLRGSAEQAEGDVLVTKAWREHVAEEAALFDYLAEYLRRLLIAAEKHDDVRD